ncbi:unnamed protein product [Pleuronectes platessa]|uniref:PR domain containing 8 n=1 Tax=Pleuronectes platessa TaxID=8262 RepID=A0A9N7YGH0_PLEPL|nr:unnamed protein product [Pleuronectes platessa]
MDHSFLPRSIWTSDSKFLQHPADLYSSVVVTRSIPAGTCFGPCVLQNTFYETIAFIAQKSFDRRAKPYVFRVDPEAMRNSALVLSWLRLVQAARNGEEQNTEAFLKAGQLYVRTTRDIRQEEELLVWYDQELSHLLGFTDMSRGSGEEYRCCRCNQVFKNEYPFLAHCRFLCTQVKSDPWGREVYAHKHVEIKRQRRVTDFHNIARDLEHKRPSGNEDAEIYPKRRKYEETLYPKGRKTVLLEKTNISNDDNITQLVKGYDQAAGDASSSAGKLKGDKIKPDHLGCKVDDDEDEDVDVVGAKDTFTHGREMAESSEMHSRSSSAFSLVRAVLGYNNLMASSVLSGDLQSGPTPVALNNTFHYAPEHWSRSVGAQLQTASSLTILPPTYTSFGVSVQNWCAKCNLSFRMTSDLVFHMRSHHKKEFAVESQVRRRREEKLTCPICHEYFRERHHLSRHMTSHN